MLLLGVIFVTLIAGSVQSVTADHLFEDENVVNYVSTKDSKYQIHIQVQVRNEQGQLVSISEASQGNYVPEGITDLMFEKLGKKEIVTIDNIKYEKAQYVDSPMKDDKVDYISVWALMACGEILGHGHKCVSVFQASTAVGLVTQTDVVTNQWTILRDLD